VAREELRNFALNRFVIRSIEMQIKIKVEVVVEVKVEKQV
jgi:hypothetical protein